MDQAVPPGAFDPGKFTKEIVKKTDKIDASREDRKILALANSEGWKAFKEVIEARIALLKSMVDPESGQSVISSSEDPAIVGQKYLIIAFAIYQLRRALELPEAVRSAENVRRTEK